MFFDVQLASFFKPVSLFRPEGMLRRLGRAEKRRVGGSDGD